jgi:hypothetical protein
VSASARNVVAVIGLALLLFAGLYVAVRVLERPPPAPPEGVRLGDLGSLDQLRGQFNADQGVPRVVLVLSPT